ncbi:MAG: GIY-YIG nuclease family protein, partial [Methylococcaceae bacterium]|nr:GIY-YIG nuclease family protein [Methylococcaceae bacterium]
MESKNYYPPSSKKGFVYILSNISMPGIIKVGRTGKVPELRIKDKDLCSTGVPTPFVAEYYAFFDNMYEAEKKAHINLRVYSHGKEFFKVDIPTAIKQIERIKIDSIEIYPNKGGLSHIAFDDIQKRCPNCSKVNIIPEYIKHDK